jgi:hypothetical protein
MKRKQIRTVARQQKAKAIAESESCVFAVIVKNSVLKWKGTFSGLVCAEEARGLGLARQHAVS